MRRAVLGGLLACSVLVVVSSGCGPVSSITIGKRGSQASHHGDGHGPPPHAPAHGYRHKQHTRSGNLELRFDSTLGVYVVIDLPNHYYWDGYYLRIEDGSWYASTDIEGRWKLRSSGSLPPGLRKKHAKHGKVKRNPGKGRGPAKGHW